MKQSDIFTLVMIAGIGTLVAFFLCNSIMGDPNSASTTFTKLSKVIESNLGQPEPEVFNSYAINPTIEVFVGDCEDVDRNGIIDNAELIMCGKVQPEEDATTEDAEEHSAEAEGE